MAKNQRYEEENSSGDCKCMNRQQNALNKDSSPLPHLKREKKKRIK